MKTKSVRSKKPILIANNRWLAYATAGVATAIAGVNSAEADIHYSGTLNVPVPEGESVAHSFALDNAAVIRFVNIYTGSLSAALRVWRCSVQNSGSGGFEHVSRFCGRRFPLPIESGRRSGYRCRTIR